MKWLALFTALLLNASNVCALAFCPSPNDVTTRMDTLIATGKIQIGEVTWVLHPVVDEPKGKKALRDQEQLGIFWKGSRTKGNPRILPPEVKTPKGFPDQLCQYPIRFDIIQGVFELLESPPVKQAPRPLSKPPTPARQPVVKPEAPAPRPVSKPTAPVVQPAAPAPRPVSKPAAPVVQPEVPAPRPVSKPAAPVVQPEVPAPRPISTPSPSAGKCSISANTVPQLLKLKNIPFNANAPLKEQYRTLLQKVSHGENTSPEALNGLVEIFDEMVKREFERCQTASVFYVGAGFAGVFIIALSQFVPGSDERSATAYFQETLETVADKLHADRDRKIGAHLRSASLSLASVAPKESAVDMFLTAMNVNLNISILNRIIAEIMAGQSADKIKRAQDLAEFFSTKISRALIQEFIATDSLSKLVYLSKPFGHPIDVDPKIVLTQMAGGPSAFQALIAGNEAYRRKMNAYGPAYGVKINEPRFFDYVQARIFDGSPEAYDKSKVSIFFNYLPSEKKDGIALMHALEALFSP